MKLSLERLTFNLFSIITISVNVFLFIPILIYGLLKKEKDLVFYFPLFCAIIASTFTPPFEFDLYRHYESYDYYCRNQSIAFSIKDLYLPTINYLGCNLGFTHKFIYFISTILYYFTVCYIIKKLFDTSGTYFLKLCLILILILTNNFVDISGIRFPVALAFSYLYFFYLPKNKGGIVYLFMALAILSHFSMLILIFIHFTFLMLRGIFTRNFSIIISSITLVIGLFFVKPIVELSLLAFQNFLGIYIGAETYTSGEWGADRLDIQGYNSTGVFVEKFKLYYNVFIIWISIILFSKNVYYKTNYYKIFIISTCILFLFIPFDTIFYRYQFFVIFLSVLLLYEQRYTMKRWIQITLVSILLSRILIQYTLGFLSNYKLFIVDVFSGNKLYSLGILPQLIN